MLRVLASFALFAACLPAQDLTAAMRKLVDDPRLAGGRVGVVVLDLETGGVLCANDADSAFVTASNMKLISSAVALTTLGPEYRFRTLVQARGTIEDGVLRGDLELVGSGDPTLGGRHEHSAAAPLERFAAAISEQGIRRVTGRVLGNDNCQPDEILGTGWSWNDESAAYSAQMSGLCFAENCIRVVIQAKAPGAPAKIRLIPETDYVAVTWAAAVRADKRAGPLRVQRQHARNRVVVSGAMPAQSSFGQDLSVDNPTGYAAHVLRETLLAKGIAVGGAAMDLDFVSAGSRPMGEPHILAEHLSPPLAEILVTLNKVSQNLYAEQLIRAASRHAGGKSDMRSAAAHAGRVLRELGVDTAGMKIADGSGLTRLNLVHPAQLAALLAGIWRGPHRDLFLSTLPVAGVDGTLRSRFGSSAARGHVRAKTGYIRHVVALSGYVPRPGADRPPLVFSILVNNFVCKTSQAKAAVDRFVGVLAQRAGWAAKRSGRPKR